MANGSSGLPNYIGSVDTPVIPPSPPTGTIVTNRVLYDRRLTSSTLARAFAGTSDPSIIWTSLIADQQDAYPYMRELEEKDEDVGAALEQLKLAVLRCQFDIVAANDTPEAKRVADRISAILTRCRGFDNWRWSALDAPGYGCTISEIMWDYADIDGAFSVVINEIRDVPQELFNFNPPGFMQNGPLRLLANYYDPYGGVLVPESKFVIWSYAPRCGNRKGSPLIRKVFWPSWFKRQTIRFWLRFGERGPGTAVTKYRNGATQSEKDEALAAAEAIIENVAMAVPDNFGIVMELLTAARSQDPKVYQELADRMEKAIYRRIKGEILTSHGSEDGYGSRALGQVHENTFEQKYASVASSMSCTINEQLIRPLVLWNFGPDALPLSPSFTIDTSEGQDLVNRIKVDMVLQKMGIDYSINWLRQVYGVPEPVDAEDTAVAAAPPAPFGGDGAGAGAGGGDGAEPPSPDTGTGNTGYSESNLPAHQQRSLADIKRLMRQLRAEAGDDFRARVLALVEEARNSYAPHR